MPLPEKDRNRLIALLGMLGSHHDGEVANAGRMASRLIVTHKLTWADVLNGTALNSNGYSQDDIVASYSAGLQEGMKQGMNQAKADAAAAKFRAARGGGMNSPFRTWCQNVLDDHEDDLTSWEREFLESFLKRGWDSPTEKQEAVMIRIGRKTGLEPPENF
jgi:hypothetical protein